MRILLALMFCSSIATAQVWEDTREWNSQWENAYSEWVQKYWHKDFFAVKTLRDGSPNPYYGIRPDCADTVYSMRLIFAYENKLPFVIQDPSKQGNIISNRTKKYRINNEREKIRKFITEIYGIVSTRSMPNDSFPVTVSREWMRAGSMIRTVQKNHHSWTVKDILPIGVPHLVYNSTVGSRYGAWTGYSLMERISWPNPRWIFEGNFSPSSDAGFRWFRQPQHVNKPVWQVPGFSEEQFQIPIDKWTSTLKARLSTKDESIEQELNRLLATACESLKDRVNAIREGVEYLNKNPNRCMDYATYDTYSTPNRDKRFFDDLLMLRNTYHDALKNINENSLPGSLTSKLNVIYPHINERALAETQRMHPMPIDQNSYCVVTYDTGKAIDLVEAKRRLFLGLMSNNPHDSITYRWGEEKGPSPLAKRCQSWDHWVPDLSHD